MFLILSNSHRKGHTLYLEARNFDELTRYMGMVVRRKHVDIIVIDGITGELLKIRRAKDSNEPDYVSESYRTIKHVHQVAAHKKRKGGK